MSTSAPSGRTALITGGSAGIGASAAAALAARGWNVVVTGRDPDRLARIEADLRARHPSQAFATKQFDVAAPDQVAAAILSVEQSFGQVDLLVASAGIGVMDFLDRMDPESGIRRQIDTNLLGTILVVQAVLPSMIARREGTIILVGSLAGLVATPTYSIYAATKFGLRGFADALRREAGVWGIRVVHFLPGAVDTGFAEESVARRRTRLRTPRRWVLSVEATGTAIADLADRPKPFVVLPWRMRPILWLARLWPGLVDWATERYFVRRERAVELGEGPSGRNGGPDQRL